jgi:GNAT superfamily N-acetyltransferase
VRLRPGTPDDFEIVIQHRIAMFRDMGYSDAVLARIETVSRPLFGQSLTDGNYYALFAEREEGEEVVGGGGVLVIPWPGTQPRKAFVLNVYVEPEFRRQGIARDIMGALLEWCRGQGFDSVSLHASEEGRPLYEQLGFQPTNEMRLNL